jgi:hypothetical protein
VSLIRVNDLKDHYIGRERPILLCVGECGGEFSATRGDYFQLPADHIFECCDEPMRLVFKRTRYVDAKRASRKGR